MSQDSGDGGGDGGGWAPGAVVWVKLGSCWWPGSVVDAASLPPDALRSLRKAPLAIVHFFQEDYYEFVRNASAIYPYNCSRKEEFIKKGLDMYRSKQSHNLDKFPEDVIRAEELTGGDLEILTWPQYQQEKKESYAGLFGEATPRRAGRVARGRGGSGRSGGGRAPAHHNTKESSTPSNYKAHILVQSGSTPAAPESAPAAPATLASPATPAGHYTCHACAFSSARLNVMILHTKTHSGACPPLSPAPRPRKSPPNVRDAIRIPRKRVASRQAPADNKKRKSVVEIKNTLLADWEDGDDSSTDEALAPASSPPQVESTLPPASPTTPPLPTTLPPAPATPPPAPPTPPPVSATPPPAPATPPPQQLEAEPQSCFDFRDEEETPAGALRGTKRGGGVGAEDMAREVAELLEQTAMPTLPPPPTHKTIFKTKTFFRSRHSRSQDAIEKYVAEQLNVDRHSTESPPPELTLYPSVEEVTPDEPAPKLPRLAPKMHLKKLCEEARERAEAAEVGPAPPLQLMEDDAAPDRLNGDVNGTAEHCANTDYDPNDPVPSQPPLSSPPQTLESSRSTQHADISNDSTHTASQAATVHIEVVDSSIEGNHLPDEINKHIDNTLEKSVETSQTDVALESLVKQYTSCKTDDNVTESDLQIAETLISMPDTALARPSGTTLCFLPQEPVNTPVLTTIQDTLIDKPSQPAQTVSSNKSLPLTVSPAHNSDKPNLSDEVTLDHITLVAKPSPLTPNHTVNSVTCGLADAVAPESTVDTMTPLPAASPAILNVQTTKTKVMDDAQTVQLKQGTDIGQTQELNLPTPELDTTATHEENNELITTKTTIRPATSNTTARPNTNSVVRDTSAGPSKLLRILEEKRKHKPGPTNTRISPPIENILNFNAKSRALSPTPNIIIRRAVTPNKPVPILGEPERVVLSRSSCSTSVYTIQTAESQLESELAQTKTLSPAQPSTKNSIAVTTVTDEALFDISSMPIVLSEDLTPADRAALPLAPSEPAPTTSKPALKPSRPPVTQTRKMVPADKSPSPNILSKSTKPRGKHLLIVDKTTGQQKIIMSKQAIPTPAKNKGIVTAGPSPKADKFIIVPAQRPAAPPPRAHKILISSPVSNKPTLAAPPAPAGGTVMIITNAQGGQSRIVLSAEHEKLLFPNKNQQMKHAPRPATAGPPSALAKTQVAVSTPTTKHQVVVSTLGNKPPPRVITKPKQTQQNAIITSKGQLMMNKFTPPRTTAPAPRAVRPAAPAPVSAKEPLILLQQKSGAIMQLTSAQFQHLHRTGQIVQKSTARTVTKQVKPSLVRPALTSATQPKPKPTAPRPAIASPAVAAVRAPATTVVSPGLAKPVQAATSASLIAPLPQPAPAPPLAPAHNNLSDLDNLEELLPSTAIARPPASALESSAAPLQDKQLLAVPGENFGGPPNTFYLCVEENGTLTPIDNRPLVLENNQLVPAEEPRDILAAALANTDVFRASDEPPDFRDLNANVSVHCRVSETSMTLNQPIMTPLEVPSASASDGSPAPPPSLSEVIGAGSARAEVPVSLELPITVTDPRIAPPRLLRPPSPLLSISMPLLTEEDETVSSTPAPAPAPL